MDEAGDGTFHVWDYKTGSALSVREGTGLRGGRQIQPALYAMALRDAARPGRAVPGKVSRSGYFFPGRKGEGQRMARRRSIASQTREALRRLFDLLGRGHVPARALRERTAGSATYEAICGGTKRRASAAREKLAADTRTRS